MTKLLPLGSVVLLKNSSKKLMIVGFCQKEIGVEEKIWDYCGCVFPEGYLGGDKTFLFDADQVESIYYIGYQDEAQMKFMQYVTQVLNEKKGE